MMEFFKKPANRKYIYLIITAGIAILVTKGIIGPEEQQVWLNFAAAVLGVGASALASANTPSKEQAIQEAVQDGEVFRVNDFHVPDGSGKHRAED